MSYRWLAWAVVVSFLAKLPVASVRDGGKNAGPGAQEARLPASFLLLLVVAFVAGVAYAALVW